MLYLEAVYPSTLDLLKKIMAIPELSDFYLAGGTALALQIGHRVSVDLDLFGKTDIDFGEVLELLSPISSPVMMSQSKSVLVLNISGVKVDFVKYKYELLSPIKIHDKIRLCSIPDIAAMKLAAIAGRGKKRDFYDIFFLLQQFNLKKLIEFYNQKYPDGSEFIVVKSLSYFEDAEGDEEPELLINTDWNSIKRFISQEVRATFGN